MRENPIHLWVSNGGLVEDHPRQTDEDGGGGSEEGHAFEKGGRQPLEEGGQLALGLMFIFVIIMLMLMNLVPYGVLLFMFMSLFGTNSCDFLKC